MMMLEHNNIAYENVKQVLKNLLVLFSKEYSVISQT